MPAEGDLVARVLAIRTWSRGGVRAPHKPLLLLYALGRLQRLGTSAVAFVDAEPDLLRLLGEYGPTGRSTTPAYPFHRLQNDGLWVVRTEDDSAAGDSPTRLRESGAVGAFPPQVEDTLRADSGLAALVARAVLDANFPESLHGDLCRAAGLDIEALEIGAARTRAVALRQRDPRFREAVLVAYEYRCAMCGYDGRMGNDAVGLDAAHVRWWAFDGPDHLANGMCLCSFHHKLLDRGVLGLTGQHEVAVSQHFVGRGRAAEEMVLGLAGQPLLPPQPGHPLPAEPFVTWHRDQVFRTPARAVA